MGFLDRMFPKVAPSNARPKAPTVTPEYAVLFGVMGASDEAMDDFVCIPVAGESHYQEALQGLRDALDVIGRDGYGFVAQLTREPNNPHDPNAIAVQTPSGTTLGYVRRDVAADYHAFVRSLQGPVECAARLVGGTDGKPSVGVVLDFTQLAALKRQA